MNMNMNMKPPGFFSEASGPNKEYATFFKSNHTAYDKKFMTVMHQLGYEKAMHGNNPDASGWRLRQRRRKTWRTRRQPATNRHAPAQHPASSYGVSRRRMRGATAEPVPRQRVWGMGSSLHSLMSIVAGRGRRARADGLYALVSVLS